MAGEDGFGTQLQRFGGSSFAAIASITSIAGPGLKREVIDVTAHDSPNGWMEFLGGLKDGGEVSFDINRRPAVHDVLIADFEDDEPRSYRVEWPSGAAWTFDGILTGYEADSPYDDKLSASVTLKVTGQPTVGDASSL
jgi:predicted secreted protein